MNFHNMQQKITINSIFEGQQPSFHFGQAGQFLSSIGIDPDVPLSDTATDIKTSGVLRPVKYAAFSGAPVNSHPIAIITNPKNALVYAILRNGKLISYSSSLGSETTVGTVSGSQASGGFYYNNYIYILGTGASHDDVSRYGPLDNSPSLTDGVWKGATLGSLTALTDTTYPTTRNSVQYLNHGSLVHIDNKAYFLDFKAGVGYVHYIKTTKVTNEGDTNNSSAYNALDLPLGWMPFNIEAFGSDVVISASFIGTDTVLKQGSAALFFWDTTSSSFYRVVFLPDPICPGLKYGNGVLYTISGHLAGGVRLARYVGGDSIETIKYMDEGHPPLQNAVDMIGNRVVWAGFSTYPANAVGLHAYGSKSDLFPRGLHNIALSALTATSSNGVVTALNCGLQGMSFPKFIFGGTDGSNTMIEKQSSTYGTHYWRSPVFNIGKQFAIDMINLRLGAAIAANMTIVPTLYFDNESSSQAGTTINTTSYPNSERAVALSPDSFSAGVTGQNNFFLELKWTGTALLPVLLPITILIDVDENNLN